MLELMFEPGSKIGDTACVTVQIVDDTQIEADERFWLSLEQSEAVTVDMKDENKVVVVIEDNEGKWVLL